MKKKLLILSAFSAGLFLHANAQQFAGGGVNDQTSAIARTGSVGIGTATPNSNVKLNVVGKTMLTDKVAINLSNYSDPNAALVTVSGGDLRIIETTDYSKMPDGNGADIYLQDKTGTSLNIFQSGGMGHMRFPDRLKIGGDWTGNLALTTTIYADGRVAIGAKPDGTPLATPAGYRLFVKDGILTEKLSIAVSTDAVNWADYVFDKGYDLKPLSEVEKYVKENKHLPEVPSAKEVYSKGINVAQMDATLLKKIEELTLYVIELQKQSEVQASEIKALKKQ